ncbi:hypothetical protein SmJEL517_g04621 [Synchytrium microbalum]|uniref:RRM domain-containing protein n=1 Tax=Synchytrium microbalum TaxID=1806994 RepID=A0A507BXQ5_9FUNG|nr:uncharacterized protein SmJEL517_g04621 [Synchytrium microbalum]TPX32212.1 hypothetical protein SmJEL517_g04621 [Synchytrium microbalum]
MASSRLVVKNVPSYMSQDKFKAHFSKKGTITDVKLVTTEDGRSRRFGYIGYKTEEEARSAQQYFDNTFIDTAKIQVEFAKRIGDPSLPRPWSRYSEGSSAHEKTATGSNATPLTSAPVISEKDSIKARNAAAKVARLDHQTKLMQKLATAESDPQFQEYMQAMKPRAATGRTWANDDMIAAVPTVPAAMQKKKKKRKATDLALDDAEAVKNDGQTVKAGDDDTLYQDLPVVEAAVEPPVKKMKKSKTNRSERSDAPAAATSIVVESVANNPAISDLDYFKSKISQSIDIVDDTAAQDAPMNDEAEDDVEDELMDIIHDAKTTAPSTTPITPPASESPPPPLPADIISIISDTGRLFIKNLAFACTQSDLEALFSPFGPVSEIHLSINKTNLQPKGYAFVTYMIPEHALKAYLELDGFIFQGRILEVLPGREKMVLGGGGFGENGNGGNGEGYGDDGLTFKQKREKKRKEESGHSFTWNTLFMNSDAVVESMARSLNVPKSAILDPSSSDMAVRLALAETHVITETKQFFAQHGVSIDAFETGFAKSKKSRSDTVILVKNIPATTVDEEMRDLFGRFGTMGRVLLPPSRTIALVEYMHPTEAKVAFKSLAYTKFKHLPLFLEWAPTGTFSSPPETTIPQITPAPTPAPAEPTPIPAAPITLTATPDDMDLTTQTGPTTTLFIKNLNFDTTESALKDIFPVHEFPSVKSVRVATKPDKKTGRVLSMGFGFVEFGVRDDAAKALKVMQGHVLDNHALTLKVSNTTKPTTQNLNRNINSSDIAANGTKLIVRNIPFEASKKDIKSLFSTFGKIKSLRLPLKLDGSHRGFGFIDFLTKQEAKNAFESLHATHLYGRHLVLEWAKDDVSVEDVRESTRRSYGVSRKVGRVVIGDDGEE